MHNTVLHVALHEIGACHLACACPATTRARSPELCRLARRKSLRSSSARWLPGGRFPEGLLSSREKRGQSHIRALQCGVRTCRWYACPQRHGFPCPQPPSAGINGRRVSSTRVSAVCVHGQTQSLFDVTARRSLRFNHRKLRPLVRRLARLSSQTLYGLVLLGG